MALLNMAAFLFKYSMVPIIAAIGLGYILNFTEIKYRFEYNAVKMSLDARFLYNKKLFCMEMEDGTVLKLGSLTNPSCDGSIKILNQDLFFDALFMGFPAVSLGEAYFNEYWIESDGYDLGDILTVLSLSSYNVDPNGRDSYLHIKACKFLFNVVSLRKWSDWFDRSGFRTLKTEGDDAQTISHHYDIGNDFYSLFLDPLMVYSCAIWDEHHGVDTLEEAQRNKVKVLYNKMESELDRNGKRTCTDGQCQKDDPEKRKRKILEIGSGWGFTSSFMANESALNEVVGITLSAEQLKWSERVWGKYSENLRFEYRDYRKMLDPQFDGYFDGVISIGMLEHVHLLRIDEFLNVSSFVLSDGGVLALHYITRNDIYPLNSDINNNYFWPSGGRIVRENGCSMISFVSKYIFPGGCLLLSDWVHETAKKHDLVQIHKEFYGLHYAKTLRKWRENFNANWKQIGQAKRVQFKYDDHLFKIWNFYLANCEAVFRIQYVDLVQQIFVKSKNGLHDQFKHITNPNQYKK